MKWCLLLGHRFEIKQVGNASMKICPRCGKTYILMEKRHIVTGKSQDDYWKEVKPVVLSPRSSQRRGR